MSLRVLKFGGSSLNDGSAIARVADILAQAHRQGDTLVVVCSAMGQSTEQLLQLAAELAPGCAGRELDMLLTAGERIAAALLALRLVAIGVPALSLTGSQSGIVTDGSHGEARILAVRPHRIVAGLQAGKVVVVAGFQGVSEAGDVTSLGRGGSDTTAVALSVALQAARCEVYSDVDGVFSADPRLVQAARHWPAIDAEAMAALAAAGGRVLAAEAAELAARSGSAIVAGRSDMAGRQTLISGSWHASPPPLAAVAHLAGWQLERALATPWPPALPPGWARPWLDADRCFVRAKASQRETAPPPGWPSEAKATALTTAIVRPSIDGAMPALLEAAGEATFLGADATAARWSTALDHAPALVRALHAVLPDPSAA